VGELIFGVVVDILIHVSVENLEGRGVEWAATPSWNLIVLDSSKFVVLNPQVGLDDLGSGQKP